ncbi:SusC/RagA family TonB-linked outer membrane protein [Chitinophaga sp. S165]|uniref:SusC/RagA family TonB-linked outer membrane protein n=1 Tax=Chitinophaga sp. S165 TaxID=2135462 RepID=UPI000D70D937|nr:SusC/RagA family TonB-linked outer membrane protein [Chitinophaga sp. S165]PWV51933.1 TonB-linked SusC/RagA family outer membrane protein [Chitinophaga sp. S165]
MSRILKGYPAVNRLVMCLLLLHIGLLTQAHPAKAGKKVTIIANQTPLREILLSVTRQTGYEFVYHNEDVNERERISGRFINQEVDEFLSKLFSGKGVSFSYKGNAITIRKKSEFPVNNTRISEDSASAGTVSISGRITDGKGNALPGATVMVKGTRRGVSADGQGQFVLASVLENATLSISLIGYEMKEVALTGNSFISIQLKQAVGDLDEAVVVAYNTTTIRNNTGAITVVKGKDIQNLPNRSLDKSLQGLVPGLLVTGGSGQPGAGLANMVIRGISTGSSALNGQTIRNPLIVIDGIPVTQDQFQQKIGANVTPISNPMSQLNPSDIASISVLKDAAAIALYGSKASNGVILVTTKRGKSGKTTYSFRHQTDFSNPLNSKTNLLSKDEYLKLLFDTYRNTDSTLWTDEKIKQDLYKKFPTTKNASGETIFYPEPDFKSEIYDGNAATISNELSVSGGSGTSNFYLNLEYTKQDGIVKGTDFNRKSLRFNFENRPSQILKFGLNSALSYTQQNYANGLEAISSFGASSVASPLNPIRFDDGSYRFIYPYGALTGSYVNPVAEADFNINRNTAYRGLAKGYAELSFLKYFTLSANLGADVMFAENKEKNDPRFYSSTSGTPLPRISELDTRRTNIISTNTIRYDRSLNDKMNVNVVLGQESQILIQRMLGAEATGGTETLPYYDELNSPGYKMSNITGQSSRQTLLSMFGQANFSYDNKYLLSASLRRDGSSKFGTQQRWGNYWSVGGGWVASGERFTKETLPWMDYLKIRASFGAAGNSSAIDAFTRFERIAIINYQGNSGVQSLNSPGNPNIRWEQTFSWDAGMETRFFNERVGFTFDIYNKKTSGLIYQINLGSISGYSNVLANIGDMENKGIEISLNSIIVRTNNFKWNFNANWSTNQNKLIKANVSLSEISGSVLGNEEGRNFNSFYMPVWAGVNTETGLPQWIGKDGKPTSKYSDAPKQFVGKPQPDAFGAITNSFIYKGFELSAMLYYQYGLSIYDNTAASPLLTDGTYPYANQTKSALNYWKKPGDNVPNPRRLLNNRDRGNSISTRYLYEGNYLRLQNVSLTYTFSPWLTQRISIKMLKLYVQAHNVALLSSFKGPDPDNTSVGGSTKFAYPNQRSYSVGLNLNF